MDRTLNQTLTYSGEREPVNPDVGAQREYGKRTRYPHTTRHDFHSWDVDQTRSRAMRVRRKVRARARWRDAAWQQLGA